MSRYFGPIAKEALAKKILEAAERQSDFQDQKEDQEENWKSQGITSLTGKVESGHFIPFTCLTPIVKKDLAKVEFDLENIHLSPKDHPEMGNLLGFHEMTTGLVYFGAMAGGDWECPVYFIIYWDGKQLRGYIPKNGNPWNRKTKRAYGNSEVQDNADCQKQYGMDYNHEIRHDPVEILLDVQDRIKAKAGIAPVKLSEAERLEEEEKQRKEKGEDDEVERFDDGTPVSSVAEVSRLVDFPSIGAIRIMNGNLLLISHDGKAMAVDMRDFPVLEQALQQARLGNEVNYMIDTKTAKIPAKNKGGIEMVILASDVRESEERKYQEEEEEDTRKKAGAENKGADGGKIAFLAGEILKAVGASSSGSPAEDVVKNVKEIDWKHLTPQVEKDLSAVTWKGNKVDIVDILESQKAIQGFKIHGGMAYLGLQSFEGWGSSLFFAIYHDGKELRGCIPIDGNVVNTSTMTAYRYHSETKSRAGYDADENDEENARERFPQFARQADEEEESIFEYTEPVPKQIRKELSKAFGVSETEEVDDAMPNL